MRDDIIKVLAELRPEFDFCSDVDFIEEGMLDSFDIISLISILEEKFGVSIRGIDILPENFSSIEKIEGLLKK